MSYRFIHCADVHLGKGAHAGTERYGDYFRAFASLAAYAAKESVDAVLIAGDFFDEQEPSAETLMGAMRVLRPLREAGIPVYAIEGNHDRRKRTEPVCALDILAGEAYLHLLRPSIAEQRLTLDDYEPGRSGALVRPVEGIAIAGLGFIGHNPELSLEQAAEQLPRDAANIVLFHTMVVEREAALDYGYCLYADIAPLRERIAYLALGHRHTRTGARGEFDGWVYNPGSLEYVNPADFRQPAELRGFFDVTIDGREIRARHVASEKRRSVAVAVDISHCYSPDDVRSRVLEEAERAAGDLRGAQPIVVVRLQGAYGIPRHTIPRAGIAEALRERLAAVHVEVTDEDMLQDAGASAVMIGADALGEVEDKARAVMTEIMQARGIAPGGEATFTAALLDWKSRLSSAAESPSEELLEEMRGALGRFAGDAP